MSQYRGVDRHRFEPARLVLGLSLIGVALVVFLQVRDGDGRLPVVVLAAVIGGALLLAGVVSAVTRSVRSSREDKRREKTPEGPGV